MRFDSYVYKHFNPQTGVCFYVGIGTGNGYARAYSSANRNRHWRNVVNKYGLPKVKFFAVKLTKDEACKIEIEQIRRHGRVCDGGTLVNASLGGENSLYGIPRTKEHSEKIAAAQRGKIVSEITRQKQSAAKKGKKLSAEHVEKIASANRGRIVSEELRKRYSLAKKGVKRPKQTPEHIEARRAGGCFEANKKPVKCLNNGVTYPSAKAAAEALGIKDNHIGTVCNGNRPHTNGYKFIHV